MAKTRHQPEPTSNRTTMAVLVAGGVLVAALVVWALTRTVEPSTESVMQDVSTAPAPSAAASSTQPIPPSTAGFTGAIPSAPSAVASGQTTPPPLAQPQGDRSAVQRMAVEDLRAKLNRNEVTVIDVRPATDFANGHIPGSINVPFASVESMLDTIPRDKPIVTYCT